MVLGGESRSAIISLTDGDIALPACPVLTPVDGIVRYIVVILSPMFPERKPEPGASLPGLPGSLVSACLLRAERWGGWDPKHRLPYIPIWHPAVCYLWKRKKRICPK